MRMRLIAAVIAVTVVALSSLAGCGGTPSTKRVITPGEVEKKADEGIKVAPSPEAGLPEAPSPATISLVENIAVNDLPQMLQSVVISVVENIRVTDSPTLTPQEPPPPQVQPLPPPVLTSPGSSSAPGPTLSSLTPEFKWSSVSGADYYGLYIVDIANQNIVFDSQTRNIKITQTVYTLPSGVLAWGKSYRWYMNSHNSAGWGSNSASLYFKIQTAQ